MSWIGACGPASCARTSSSDLPINVRLSWGDGSAKPNSVKTERWHSNIKARLSTSVPSKSKTINLTTTSSFTSQIHSGVQQSRWRIRLQPGSNGIPFSTALAQRLHSQRRLDVGFGSISTSWQSGGHFWSTPMNGYSQIGLTRLKRARTGHEVLAARLESHGHTGGKNGLTTSGRS
jgi:hypothetical protein